MQAVLRALRVLETVAEAKQGVALTELSRAVGLSVATTHRMLATLVQAGYVRQDPGSGYYLLGSQFLRVARQSLDQTLQLRALAKPFLQELVARTGETANLRVLDGDEAIGVEQIPGNHMVRAVTHLYERAPLHCSGVGKSLLAFQADQQRAVLMARVRFQRFTDRTIQDHGRLREEIDRVRVNGFAVDDEEMEPGTRCVAAPVLVSDQVVAAISITGPMTRITDSQIEPLSVVVRDVAARLAAAVATVMPELAWVR
ncbi:MAG: IclR family transcriptional regulator [Chloroflexi bacterium]|nr:IclR family transcriptional regulator [Chloroflexota bacterium]